MTEANALDVDTIEAARADGRLGRRVVLFKSTDSTNDIAWQYASNPANDGLCVLAESQHKGRGRRGRTWHSRPSQSILASILLLNEDIDAEQLTLTVAVAAAEAIGKFCDLPARIKWPNDILIDGKKLAGILVEKKKICSRHNYVVGIGINCGQSKEDFKDCDLKLPAASIATETGEPIDRNQLVCELLASLESRLAADIDTIVHRWQQLSALLGRQVTVESDNQIYSGFCRGIDPAEGLIVQLNTGPVKIFPASQTTIQSID